MYPQECEATSETKALDAYKVEVLKKQTFIIEVLRAIS
jgi:hypothetical protein